MVQKFLAMVAILGAIAGLGIGMVTTGQVKAMSVQSIDWHCIWQKDSNGYDVCISYNQPQQPTFKQVDCVSCENGCGCYGSSAINQPAISQVEWGSICGSGGCFNGNHICSDGDSCNSAYTQHPTFQQIDNGYCGQRGFSWENCGYEQPQQPTIQGVAFVQPDNCFWSYPVQCN